MYEAVHARPDGESTVARQALVADSYGFDGIVVRNHGDSPATYDPEAVRDLAEIDVVTGVEVRAEEGSRAGAYVDSHRADRTVVLVHGGDPTLNRFAVEQPEVDVLAHPMAGDGDFNHVLARTARDNGVRVEFNLRRVLRAGGGRRVRAIEALRKLHRLVETYDVPYVLSADPTSHLELRDPRALQAVGESIGLTREWVHHGLLEWQRLAVRNRGRASDAFVEPGVWRCEEE